MSSSSPARSTPTSRDPDHAEPTPRANSAAHNLPGTDLALLHLRQLPLAEAEALLAGHGHAGPGLRWHEDYPMAETVDALVMLARAHQVATWTGSAAPRWWLHQIVLGDLVVGDACFHGPPYPAGPGQNEAVEIKAAEIEGVEIEAVQIEGVEVEIGYAVVPGWRGRGIAGQACRLLLAHAWAEGAAVVRADIDPHNPSRLASRRVLLRSGFRDEGDGAYVLERPVGP